MAIVNKAICSIFLYLFNCELDFDIGQGFKIIFRSGIFLMGFNIFTTEIKRMGNVISVMSLKV